MKRITVFLLSGFVALVLAACGSSELPSQSFDLNATGAGGTDVSGTALFEKLSDTETKITLELSGTPEGGDHPAHIHVGDIDPGGGIYITLANVDGTTGMSTTTVSKTDEGADVSYEDILAFDGYINIHLSGEDLTVVANGEVGAAD